MKLSLFAIISTLIILLLDKSDGLIACTEALCENQNCTIPSCMDGKEFVEKEGICQCCDACYDLRSEGQRCVRSPEFIGGGPFLAKCGKGLKCIFGICVSSS